MLAQLSAGVRIVAVMTVGFGIAYTVAVTAFAQIAVEDRADGQFVEFGGEVVGSRLIAQEFTGSGYFHSRPSGTGYDAAASTGPNFGSTNPDLLATVSDRVAAYRELNGLSDGVPIPVDAVTASGSGLDPHISPANAELQATRVANARGLDLDGVVDLVAEQTDRRPLGVLGDDAVNVIELNIALDTAAGST